MKKFFVYLHIKPTNNGINSIFYVGKGNSNRLKKITREHNHHHRNIINKYGHKNIIVKYLRCTSEEHALNLEKQIISVLRRMGVNITNVTDGGEGVSGLSHSDESKRKMSLSKKGKKPNREYAPMSDDKKAFFSKLHTGRKHTAEAREKIRLSGIGRKYPNRPKPSEETRKKLSEAGKGRVFSEETKRKISESQKGKTISEHEKERLRSYAINMSEETKKKMSAAKLGRKIPEDVRKKMSIAQRARPPMSEEQKLAIKLSKNTPIAKIRCSIASATSHAKRAGRPFSSITETLAH